MKIYLIDNVLIITSDNLPNKVIKQGDINECKYFCAMSQIFARFRFPVLYNDTDITEQVENLQDEVLNDFNK